MENEEESELDEEEEDESIKDYRETYEEAMRRQ